MLVSIVLLFLLTTSIFNKMSALCTTSSAPSPSPRRRERIPTTPDRRWEIAPIGTVVSPYVSKLGTPKQATISENLLLGNQNEVRQCPPPLSFPSFDKLTIAC